MLVRARQYEPTANDAYMKNPESAPWVANQGRKSNDCPLCCVDGKLYLAVEAIGKRSQHFEGNWEGRRLYRIVFGGGKHAYGGRFNDTRDRRQIEGMGYNISTVSSTCSFGNCNGLVCLGLTIALMDLKRHNV